MTVASELIGDYRTILEKPEGLRVFASYLLMNPYDHIDFDSDAQKQAFLCGRKSVAIQLLKILIEADPNIEPKLRMEQAELLRREKEEAVGLPRRLLNTMVDPVLNIFKKA